MPSIEISCGTIAPTASAWWLSPIVTVSLGALIALIGTILSSVFAWKMQRRNNAHSLQLQERLLASQDEIRRKTDHRSRGEEIYAAIANVREELRAITTRIAKKLEAGTFEFWDIEGYYTAGRDSLARLTLLIDLDYPVLVAPMYELSVAFKNLTHTVMPDEGKEVNPALAASELMTNMTAFSKASVVLSKALLAEMKREMNGAMPSQPPS